MNVTLTDERVGLLSLVLNRTISNNERNSSAFKRADFVTFTDSVPANPHVTTRGRENLSMVSKPGFMECDMVSMKR
jgi:hypothetical protein